jgi:hypothetical protein
LVSRITSAASVPAGWGGVLVLMLGLLVVVLVLVLVLGLVVVVLVLMLGLLVVVLVLVLGVLVLGAVLLVLVVGALVLVLVLALTDGVLGGGLVEGTGGVAGLSMTNGRLVTVRTPGAVSWIARTYLPFGSFRVSTVTANGARRSLRVSVAGPLSRNTTWARGGADAGPSRVTTPCTPASSPAPTVDPADAEAEAV